jgi:alkylation response protein AidB-like acyl-CoA dehydrogenase
MTLDSDVVDLLVDTARRLLSTDDDPARLVTELDEAGIAGYVVADRACGGALFDLHGQLLGRSTLLDLMLAGAAFRPTTRVVLPQPGRRRAPGTEVTCGGADRLLSIDGIVAEPDGVDEFLVHTAKRAVRVRAEAVTVSPTTGFDHRMSFAVVGGTVALGEVEDVAVRPWQDAAMDATIALAHQLVGAGQRALDSAVAHVCTRKQFGQPIGALQAVRHRLAMVHVELEAARAILAAPVPDEVAAMAAKAAAGRAALNAAAAAQQLSGAMGFTAEQGLHAIVRRVLLLDALFGSADDLEIQIGALLVERGALPPPAPVCEPETEQEQVDA